MIDQLFPVLSELELADHVNKQYPKQEHVSKYGPEDDLKPDKGAMDRIRASSPAEAMLPIVGGWRW